MTGFRHPCRNDELSISTLAHNENCWPFALTATASSGLTVAFASATPPVCTVNGNTVSIIAAGTCTIADDQSGDGNYNSASQVTQSFTVNKAGQTIAFAALPGKVYGDSPFAITATASSGLTVTFASTTPSVCTVNGNSATIAAAGTCTLVADQPGDGNYNAAPQVRQSFTVAKANQTITFDTLSGKVYRDAPFSVSAIASSSLAVAFTSATQSICTINGSTVSIIAAGTCTLAADQPGDGNYNAAPQAGQSFAVAKANQTTAFATLPDKVYGDSPFAITATASSGLTVAFASTTPSVCTVNGNSATIAAAGTCTLAADQSGDGNFNPAQQARQSFTVNKEEQATTFDPLENRTYRDPVFKVGATASSSLAVTFSSLTPANCTVTGDTVNIVGAGVCTIAADQPGNGNFNPAQQAMQSFTIFKADQAIAIPSAPWVVYHGTGVFGASALSGLTVVFNSQTPEVCTVSGSGQGTTVYGVAAGNCTITADQSGNQNYKLAPQVAKSFKVNKAEQKISFASLANRSLAQSPFEVSATASSGLPVSFSSLTGGVCKVSGNNVALVNTGTCTIRAEQPTGDANNNPAIKVSQSFVVTKTVTTPTTTSLLSSANPSTVGINITFTATVTAANGATPNGTVSLSESGADPTGCGKIMLNGTGSTKTAVCTSNKLSLGNHKMIASYSGDEGNEASPSTPLDQIIKPLENFALAVKNTGQGTVTGDTGGIACGATCSSNIASGTSVKLTAIPIAGYQFSGWGGNCVGYGNSCMLTMDAAKTVTANFDVFNSTLAFF